MRRLIAGLFLTLVAGCSSFGPETPPALRALDPLHDDIAGLLIAFDLPRGVGPVLKASTLSLDIAGAEPRHLKATLIEADADDVAGNLPPPPRGHAYYLLGLAPPDQAAIRKAQAAVSAAVPASAVTLAIVPHLCVAGPLDPATATISVLVALPGGPHLAPVVDNETVAAATAAAGMSSLPACV
jgi:hypothetical protein